MDLRHLSIIVLSTVSLVLFSVGSFLPGWIILHINIVKPDENVRLQNDSKVEVTSKSIVVIQIGVWYLQSCVSGNCETKSWKDIQKIKGVEYLNSIDVVEYKVEGVFILGFSIAAVAVSLANAKSKTLSLRSEATVAIILGVQAAIEVILLARIGGAHTDTEKDIAKASSKITLQFAYSLVIVSFAVFLNTVGVFLAGYGACKQKKAPETENTFTNIQSISDIESTVEVQISAHQLSLGSYSAHNLKGLDVIPEEPQITIKHKRKTETLDEHDVT